MLEKRDGSPVCSYFGINSSEFSGTCLMQDLCRTACL